MRHEARAITRVPSPLEREAIGKRLWSSLVQTCPDHVCKGRRPDAFDEEAPDTASRTHSSKLLVAQAVFEYGDVWAEIAEKLA
jgi:hypothetical protein